MSLHDIMQPMFMYPLIAGIALGLACGLLSVLVVLKRLAFLGQGITHAGFGGIGLASFLAFTGWYADLTVFIVCVITACLIAALSRNRRVMIDTAIGILLVTAMGVGILLDQIRVQLWSVPWYQWLTDGRHVAPTQWEQLLFGNILYIQQSDMWIAIVCSAISVGLMAGLYKEITFFAFDETVSRVSGIRTGLLHYLILTLLAALIVITMKLLGLLLVTSLLIIPGATALLLSKRMSVVLWISAIIAEAAMIGGFLCAFLTFGGNLPPGPFIVVIQAIIFAAAYGWSRSHGGTKYGIPAGNDELDADGATPTPGSAALPRND